MKKTAAFTALFAGAFAASAAFAQPLPTAAPESVGLSSEKLARLTEVIKSKIAEGRYPGAVALVARKGKIAYFEALGVRDTATGAPMTKDAIFRLYSMTKPFTSVAIMMLVEEGKILLGDPVSKFLPKLKGMQERIFAPLRMTDTAFHVPAAKAARIAQPFPKDPVSGADVKLLDVTLPPKNDAGGAGSAGTAMDYARFSQMLLNGGQLDKARLLGRATVAQMTADHVGDIKIAAPALARGYGFGLGFAVRRETGLNSMTGSAGEYRWGGAGDTAFWVDPKEQMVVVWMAQGQPGPRRNEDRELFRNLVQAAIVD